MVPGMTHAWLMAKDMLLGARSFKQLQQHARASAAPCVTPSCWGMKGMRRMESASMIMM